MKTYIIVYKTDAQPFWSPYTAVSGVYEQMVDSAIVLENLHNENSSFDIQFGVAELVIVMEPN